MAKKCLDRNRLKRAVPIETLVGLDWGTVIWPKSVSGGGGWWRGEEGGVECDSGEWVKGGRERGRGRKGGRGE